MANLVRSTVKLPPATLDRFSELAGELGMKRLHLMSMCSVIGLRVIERMVHPERAISPEAWAVIASSLNVSRDDLQRAFSEVSGE